MFVCGGLGEDFLESVFEGFIVSMFEMGENVLLVGGFRCGEILVFSGKI